MNNLIIITSNKNKVKEISAITGLKLDSADLEIPEIQALDVEEVAREKAIAAYKIIKKPVIVDDTGLYIEALGDLPGAFITWFLKCMGTGGIINLMRGEKNRRAYVKTCIAYADKNGARTFVGKIKGIIPKKVSGSRGFGWDAIFIPEGYKKTYSEMSKDEKNSISMRKEALKKFMTFLSSRKKRQLQ
ncbi:MAG: RdgB/HAM1 family non-canonical purine NTP pyrophosphatase [bacterium]